MGQFSVAEILSSAGKNLKGGKWPIWLAQIMWLVLSFGAIIFATVLILILFHQIDNLSTIEKMVENPSPQLLFYLMGSYVASLIITTFVSAPLLGGVQAVGLKKARGETVQASTGFHYWDKWLRLGYSLFLFVVGYLLIQLFFMWIGTTAIALQYPKIEFALRVLCGLLYSVFFGFNLLFIVDKNKAAFCALACSAKAVSHHWLKVLITVVILIVMYLIVTALISIGAMQTHLWLRFLFLAAGLIALIWLVPYAHIVFGTLYDRLTRPTK